MYDIIGDIHGHASRLAQLLERLGYAQDAQSWHHPARQLIFVGDFIDRGPEQVETYRLVRARCARAIRKGAAGDPRGTRGCTPADIRAKKISAPARRRGELVKSLGNRYLPCLVRTGPARCIGCRDRLLYRRDPRLATLQQRCHSNRGGGT